MRRVKDYLKVVAWQTGLGYLLLWAVTFWTLDEGAAVFGRSGVCLPDQAKVLFYWVCETTSPLSILASLANVALTVTVWAPVYVAAATVEPDAMAIALPILAVHLIGLPLGMFVLVRMMATALDLRRRIPGRGGPRAAAPASGAGAVVSAAPAAGIAVPAAFFSTAPQVRKPAAAPLVVKPAKAVPPRSEFGLRSRKAESRTAEAVKPAMGTGKRKG
jgi:hypothetical protein